MDEHAHSSDQDDGRPRSVAPSVKLSRTGLILSLAAMVGAGLSVYALFPESVGGPDLPVDVVLERQLVETKGGEGAIMTEVVVVNNLTDDDIARLTIDINGQYLYLQNSPMLPKESVVVPQRMFTDKRSSQRFEPDRYPVEDIVVTGQLPTGARGVSKFDFPASE